MPTEDAQAGAIAIPRHLANFPAKLAQVLTTYPLLSADDVDERSIMKALLAETADDILASPDSEGLRDRTGEPFVLLGIEGLLESTVKGREGEAYVLLRAARDDGTQFTVTTGSAFAIARAVSLDQRGLLPARVVSVELQSKSDPNRNSLWIVAAPLRPSGAPGPVVDATARPAAGAGVADDEEPF
jgi:hypothetical protein